MSAENDMKPSASRVTWRPALADASRLSVSMGITMALSLILKMYMPRLLGAEKMGAFFFAEAFPLAFISLLPLGIGSYIQRTVARRPEHAGEILFPIFLVETIIAGLLVLLMAAFLHISNYDSETVTLCLIMGVYAALFTFYSSVLKPLFFALGEVKKIAWLDIAVKILLVILVGCALIFKPHLNLIASLFVVTQVVAVAFLVAHAKKKHLWRTALNPGLIRTMLLSSLPFFLASVFTQSFESLSMFILSKGADMKEIGYYGGAQRLLAIFAVLIPILQSVLQPMSARALEENEDRFKKIQEDVLRAMLILGLPMALAMILCGREVILLLYGAEFLPATLIFSYLAPVLMLTYFNVFLHINLTLTTNGRVVATLDLIRLGIALAACWVFVPLCLEFYGAGGAGIAVAWAAFIFEALSAFVLIYFVPVKLFTPVLRGLLLKVLVPTVLVVVGARMIQDFPWQVRWGAFVILTPLYMGVLGMVKAQHIERLRVSFKASR